MRRLAAGLAMGLLLLQGCVFAGVPAREAVVADDFEVRLSPGQEESFLVRFCRDEGKSSASGDLSVRLRPAEGVGTLVVRIYQRYPDRYSDHDVELDGLTFFAVESWLFIAEHPRGPCDDARLSLRLSEAAADSARLSVGASVYTREKFAEQRFRVEVVP